MSNRLAQIFPKVFEIPWDTQQGGSEIDEAESGLVRDANGEIQRNARNLVVNAILEEA